MSKTSKAIVVRNYLKLFKTNTISVILHLPTQDSYPDLRKKYTFKKLQNELSKLTFSTPAVKGLFHGPIYLVAIEGNEQLKNFLKDIPDSAILLAYLFGNRLYINKPPNFKNIAIQLLFKNFIAPIKCIRSITEDNANA